MAGRSKGLEKFDRNGVVQHRNHVCEIALRKTINTFQKEGKMLEKELREIAKVRETLRQIRAPLRRKVFEAPLTDQDEDNGERKNGQPLRSRKISTNAINNVGTFEADSGNKTANSQRKQNTNKDCQDVCKGKTSCSDSSPRPREIISQNSAREPNRRPKRSVCYLQAPRPEALETEKLGHRKISAPAHLGIRTPNAPRASSQEGFLPPISPNTSRNSPRNIRCTPEVISVCGSDDESSARSFVGPSRAESSRYSRDMPLTPIPRGRGSIDPEEEKSLTMEETLRIKGKFRQIGHSIIATALLKGLRQKGQLTSEAIHNLHKPVSVNSEQTKEKEASNGDEKTEDEIKEPRANKNISKFRAVARKTINVNRFIVQSGRRRFQSDPASKNTDSYQVGIKTEPPRSVTKAEEQGKVDSGSRKNSEERDEVIDGEEEARDTVKNAVGNPLMNAHIARRRKFGVTAQAVIASNFLMRARSAASSADVSRDQAHNDDQVKAEVREARNSRSSIGSAGVKELTANQEGSSDLDSKQALNAGSDGNLKTVRFKLDAWE